MDNTSFAKHLGTLALVGCATAAQAQNLEVMHWWTSPAESAAVKVLADGANAAGAKWKDSAIAGMPVASKAIMTRLASGNPPAAAQFSLGRRIHEVGSEGLLGDLNDVATRDGWAKVVPPAVMQAVTVEGKVSAIPVTLAGVNWLWYSPKVLKAAGVSSLPKNMDEFMVAAEKAKAAGFTGLALGTQSWQLAWLFNNLILGNGGRTLYEQFAKADTAALQSPAATKAMEQFLKMRTLVDAGATNRNWNDATNLVLTDKAAFQFMGDWAKAEFMNAGKKPGTDFGCMLTPGDQNVYVVMGDALATPSKVNADTVAAQKKLAAVVMDPRNQRSFALAKGSLPVRTDISSAGFDDCAAMAMKLLSDPHKVIAGTPMTMTGDVNGALTDTLGKIWATPTIAPATALSQLANAIKAAK